MFMIDLGVQSDYSVLGITPQADAAEIRGRVATVFGDLSRERSKARTEEEKRRITEKQVNINTIGGKLLNAQTRAQYDLENVHLTFFMIREAASPIWTDRSLMMHWVHQAVRDFLLAKGEMVEPVTDLERSDFTEDVTHNDLLEQLLRNEREDPS